MPSFVLAAINLSPTLITSVGHFQFSSHLLFFFFLVSKTLAECSGCCIPPQTCCQAVTLLMELWAGTAHSELVLEWRPRSSVRELSLCPGFTGTVNPVKVAG